MSCSRRDFLKSLGAAGALTLAPSGASAKSAGADQLPNDALGCLVDVSLCEGCRKCEAACNEANQLPPPDKPFDDKSVFEAPRRPSATAYTVVNRYTTPDPQHPEKTRDSFVKVQCMHCKDPGCVSACIVGALTRDQATGAVVYDGSKCIGCRYCMVACPFQIPAYEYFNALTPLVRKCQYCFERISSRGGLPACVKICPKEAITFGRRLDLVTLAREKIFHPGSRYREHGPYIDHVYGEKEVGGTAWMYISSVPLQQLGFLELPDWAAPRLTESLQHGIFKYFVPPMALYALLGLAMYRFRRRAGGAGGTEEDAE